MTAKTVNKLYSVDSLNLNSRKDVARPDRFGHLYGGTFAYTLCIATNDYTVYEYNSGDDGVNVVSDNVYTTSSIAFDEEAELLFQVDVCSLLITAFDWNSETGKLSKYFYFWKSRSKCLFCQIDFSISFSFFNITVMILIKVSKFR